MRVHVEIESRVPFLSKLRSCHLLLLCKFFVVCFLIIVVSFEIILSFFACKNLLGPQLLYVQFVVPDICMLLNILIFLCPIHTATLKQ